MAAWLLRSGRLGSLKLDSWGSLRRSPASLLCTEAKEPAKPVKKAKGPDKREDEKASLWTNKTPVAFPVKLSGSGVWPPCLGVANEPISSSATSEILASATSVASPDPVEVSQILAPPQSPSVEEASIEASHKSSLPEEVPGLAVTKEDVKLGDSAAEELSSSSSSDSDSDSDLESDPKEIKLEVETETRSIPELQHSGYQEQGEREASPAPVETNAEEIVESVAEPSRGRSPDISEIFTATKDVSELSSSSFPPEAVPATTKITVEAPNEVPGNAAEVLAEAAEGGAVEEPPSVEADSVPAVVAADVSAEVADNVEELVDADQVLDEATGEELHVETAAGQPEEPAAATPAEPDEPFDNSTYKNYQHHTYNSYTFADLDVEMGKHRLPQPSSGKTSPRC